MYVQNSIEIAELILSNFSHPFPLSSEGYLHEPTPTLNWDSCGGLNVPVSAKGSQIDGH